MTLRDRIAAGDELTAADRSALVAALDELDRMRAAAAEAQIARFEACREVAGAFGRLVGLFARDAVVGVANDGSVVTTPAPPANAREWYEQWIADHVARGIRSSREEDYQAMRAAGFNVPHKLLRVWRADIAPMEWPRGSHPTNEARERKNRMVFQVRRLGS
jgi:hypothetical protein